ncbi:MAG: hypothetical protein R2730_05755 [Chitinophagales bacterium]
MENSGVFYLALLSSTMGFMCMRFMDIVKLYKTGSHQLSPDDRLRMWSNLDRNYNAATWSRLTLLSLGMFIVSPIISAIYNSIGLGIISFIIAFIAGNILNNIFMAVPFYWNMLKFGLPITALLFLIQLAS